MQGTGSSYLFDMRARGDWVRLRTLILLRWIAVIGQAGVVIVVSVTMDFALPLPLCAVLISSAVVANLVAMTAFPTETRLSERATLASLCFDLVQIVTLLMATGGLNNPFALLVIAPVTISASTLRLQPTLWLGTLAILLVAVMSNFYLPLEKTDGSVLELPLSYRAGYAVALAVAVAFLSLYARRVTVETYAMSQALSATQIALAREQRLAAIGGIAAAAAHELGTPLATIKLVARELKRELEDRPDLAEDADLIHAEAERCGRIMAELSRSKNADAHLRAAPLTAVIEEAAAPHLDRGVEIVVRFNGVGVDTAGAALDDMPIVARQPELIHGLRNLIQNAVDFARERVWVDIDADPGEGGAIIVAIGDDGPGFSPEILPRLGEPYVSSRGREARVSALRSDGGRTDGYEGMGLGVFIARTLLARTGASLRFMNAAAAQTDGPSGALILVRWPRASIRETKAESRRAFGTGSTSGLPADA